MTDKAAAEKAAKEAAEKAAQPVSEIQTQVNQYKKPIMGGVSKDFAQNAFTTKEGN
jgi:hypothetical protein